MNSFFQARIRFPELFCADVAFLPSGYGKNTRLPRCYKNENLEREAQGMYVEYIEFASIDSEQAAFGSACRRDGRAQA
jgi:hypothetical protein